MPTFSVRAARAKLEDLIALALENENVVIRDGDAAVRLVPIVTAAPKRVFGALRGKVEVGSAFFEPLPPEESSAWAD